MISKKELFIRVCMLEQDVEEIKVKLNKKPRKKKDEISK